MIPTDVTLWSSSNLACKHAMTCGTEEMMQPCPLHLRDISLDRQITVLSTALSGEAGFAGAVGGGGPTKEMKCWSIRQGCSSLESHSRVSKIGVLGTKAVEASACCYWNDVWAADGARQGGGRGGRGAGGSTRRVARQGGGRGGGAGGGRGAPPGAFGHAPARGHRRSWTTGCGGVTGLAVGETVILLTLPLRRY